MVIKRNESITVELYPEVKTGTIQVAVTPFEAKVELTGDAGEHYTSIGMKAFNDIPMGKYALEGSAEVNKEGDRGTDQGTQLKAQKNWGKYDGAGTNTSSFSACAGGHRTYYGKFYGRLSDESGYQGYWWSSTVSKSYSSYVYNRELEQTKQIKRKVSPKNSGYSVRCVKND